jgi:hypothetical protein
MFFIAINISSSNFQLGFFLSLSFPDKWQQKLVVLVAKKRIILDKGVCQLKRAPKNPVISLSPHNRTLN